MYTSEDGRDHATLEFVRAGLEGGEKVVYIASDDRREQLVERFRAGGDDVAGALAAGRFSVQAASDAHLAGGRFDGDRTIDQLRGDIAGARDEGYPAIRFAGEIDWSLSPETDMRAVIDYEDRVDTLLRETGTAALCQYDYRRFDLATVRDCERVHPLVLAERNTAGGAPCELLIERGPGRELVLRGEAGGGSCASLARSLTAAAEREPDLRVDLNHLSLIDAAGLQTIRDAARAIQAAGGQMTLVSPRPVVNQVVGLMGFDDALTIDEAS